MRFKLLISYDGAAFVGWQRQPNGRSVQGEVEKALLRLLGRPVSVQGAGRTDAGVHALGQAASFEAELELPPERLAYALNNLLPPDVRVLAAGPAAADFHARFSPSRKEYRYFIAPGAAATPFDARYVWCCPGGLDLAAMREAAATLAGEHNFRSFCAKSLVVNDYVRTLYAAEFRPAAPADAPEPLQKLAAAGELYMLRLVGNGFIYKMVRLIMGALVKLGEGKLSPADFALALAQEQPQPPAPAAPPQGLYLWGLEYREKFASAAENSCKNS